MRISPPSSFRNVMLSLALVVSLAGAAFAQVMIAPNALSNLSTATPRWTPLSAQQLAPANVQLISAQGMTAALKVKVPGFSQHDVVVDATKFQRLTIPEAGVTNEVGKPEMPMIRRFVTVPPGATVNVEVQTGAVTKVQNMNVYPAPDGKLDQLANAAALKLAAEPLTPGTFKIDRPFYARNENFPPKLAQVSKPMMLGREQVVLLEIAPMQFNPAQRALQVYPDLDVKLTFSKPVATNATVLRDPATAAGLLRIDPSILAALTRNWQYLIITADQYVEEIQPLVDWKRAKGFSVKVTKKSEVGATPAQIYNYIRAAFTDHDTRYVLLVGDETQIPLYYFHSTTSSGGTRDIPGDYYYQLVSGEDVLPDVALGRLVAHNETEVSNTVAKWVAYEKTPFPAAGGWYKKAAIISGDGHYETCSNEIATLLTAHGYTIDKFYQTMGNATLANVTNAINDGRAIVYYRNHGSPSGWGVSGFSSWHVSALTNSGKLPVVFGIACSNSQLDDPADSFGEIWQKTFTAPAYRGAAGFWGATRTSWTYENDELAKGVFKAMFNDGITRLGDVVNKSKLYLISTMGVTPYSRENLYMYDLFGDPAMEIWTKNPPLTIKPGLINPHLLLTTPIKPTPAPRN